MNNISQILTYYLQLQWKITDLVEEGKEEWVQVIDKFLPTIQVEVDKAEVEIEKVQIKDEPAGFNCENVDIQWLLN